MIYSVQDINKDVRITLEENEVSTPLIEISDNDTLSLNAIITQKIAHSVRSITMNAPSRLLEGGTTIDSTIKWESGKTGSGMGYTQLPDDFMRLVAFKMSDWVRPVTDVIHDTDEKYFLQKSKFPGIRGNINKPVCAITTNGDGKVLEFYSCNGGENVTRTVAKYIPYPNVENGAIDICPKLYTAVIYYTAALVCLTYKESEQAKLFFEISKTYIQ